jgi:hypothetical protein
MNTYKNKFEEDSRQQQQWQQRHGGEEMNSFTTPRQIYLKEMNYENGVSKSIDIGRI